MKILFHNQGIEPTGSETEEMADKLHGLEYLIPHEDAVILDVYLIDESAKASKNGLDQAVHLSTVINGDKVIVEEIENHYMQAFARAYHRFKQTLEERHKKQVDQNRG